MALASSGSKAAIVSARENMRVGSGALWGRKRDCIAPPRRPAPDTKKAPAGAFPRRMPRRSSVVQDDVGDDAGGQRDQQELAGIAAPPVVAARRAAQAVMAPVVDHVGRRVAGA